MNIYVQTVLLIGSGIVFVCSLPFVVFWCAKLGAVGYHSGKHLVERHLLLGDRKNENEASKRAD